MIITLLVIVASLLMLQLIAELNMGVFQPDGIAYSYTALRIANGQFDFGPRAPLFQILLALSFKLLGANHLSAVLIPQLFGILTALLIFIVARQLYDSRVGVIALAFAVLNVVLINLSLQILRETLLSALLLLCMYTTLRFRGTTRSLIVGSLIGLLYLVREDYVAAILPISIYLVVAEKERSKLPVLFCSALAVACPWALYSMGRYGTLLPSLQSAESYTGISYYVPSIQSIAAIFGGSYYELYLLPLILSIFAFIFLLPGFCSGIKKSHMIVLGISATLLLVDSSPVFHHFAWPMPWYWTDSSRYVFAAVIPLLVFSARGVVSVAASLGAHRDAAHIKRVIGLVDRHRVEGIILVGVLLFGGGYLPLLENLRWNTEFPYASAGEYLNVHEYRGAVMSFHPELLRKTYTGGEVFLIPTHPTFSEILKLARADHIVYILVDWSMTELTEDVILLYYRSGSVSMSIPSEFRYVTGNAYVWALFEIQTAVD